MKTTLLKIGGALFGIALMLAASLPMPVAAQNSTIVGNIIVAGGTATNSASYAATLNNKAGIITTETATTTHGEVYTETITNSVIAAADICMSSVTTTGTGNPVVEAVTPAAGSLVIKVRNAHASAAFNAALKIAFICFKP